MNNIEKYLHLFQKIEDGLPEEMKPIYLLSYKENESRIFSGYFISGIFQALTNDGESLEGVEYVTHWLDLSKLTTKEKALEIADKAFTEGRNYERSNGMTSAKIELISSIRNTL